MSWDDGERWELIDGVAYDMSPAPATKHQDVAGNIFSFLKVKLASGACRPFIAPTDVVLSEHDVVQPDIFVVCDPKKITTANIQGAPDLVFEVLSPSTSLKDRREKKALYERSGVREYVVVHPEENVVEAFRLNENHTYGAGEIVGGREELNLALLSITLPLVEVFELPPEAPPKTPPSA